ncbi:DUF695 domain-containing protein [Sulfurimonas sp.]|jgi:regulator of RNase E activity RraB|uniref:DUF695 domain-containing protein n=1 Tax=Sulfurimonas sp. TaxID=2022749 RepID=UPI0025FDF1D5|nr:DUF695 domain-containing protein [Sulfurimonas sp.]MCK9473488.1 DUF695 domain-containing protein [Sulfurimonas sp.]
MREIFSRVEDSALINIEVEVDAEEYQGSFPWLFCLFLKSNDRDGGCFEELLEIKESVIISLEHQKRAKYVGTRINDGWHEFYFYAKDSKNLEVTVSKILKESGYKYESSVVKDTKWDFYAKNLFPSELEFHNIESDNIIFLLQEEGDELSCARNVEHYASFDTATQKERFVENALTCGFEFKDDISSEEFECGVALIKFHSVTNEEVKGIVEKLYELIKKEHGYYEGWSTTLAIKGE